MGTSESRLIRLQSWIDDQFAGNVSAFCRYYNLKRSMASFIYQIVAGSRSFGERAARKLEQDTGRPEGWLDYPVEVDTTDPIQYDRALCRQLPVAERRLIEDFIGLVLARNDVRQTKPAQIDRVSLPAADQAAAGFTRGQTQVAEKARRRALNINEPPSKTPKRRTSR